MSTWKYLELNFNMKSKKIALLVFLLLPLSLLAAKDVASSIDSVLFQETIDKTFFQEKRNQLDKQKEKEILQGLQVLEKKLTSHSNDELKSLAFGYAYLQNAEQSSKYLQLYIKQALETKIIDYPVFDEIRSSNEFQVLVKKYSLRVNFWVMLMIGCGLIGIFLFIVLNLRRKGDFMANILISTFVLFHSLFAIHATFFMSRYNYQAPYALYLTTTFSFFYGPLLYFYYRRISERYQFKVRDLLHLIPSVILFFYLLNIYMLPKQQKLFLMFNRDDTSFLELVTIIGTKVLSLLIYAFLVYRVYVKFKETKKDSEPQILRWQRNLLLLNFGYALGYVFFAIGRLKIFSTTISIYPQIFLMSFIILYVGYIAYVQPRVFSKKFIFGVATLPKYQKSGLTNSFSIELKDQLLRLFIEDKIYKQSDISLTILAQKLGTTRHNVSQVINEHFELNFFHLVNKYRIEEAKEIFKNDPERNLNIIDVAYDVGFNNKVTFNKAFKAETNMTPSSYVKSLHSLGFAG